MGKYSREIRIPGVSPKKLYELVSGKVDQFLSQSGVDHVKVARRAASHEVEITSPMFSATLTCLDNALKIDGSLSLLATPFKAKIDRAIDQWVTQTFKS